MSSHVKICGITDPESAMACRDAGVDAIGLVFADSVRRVTPEAAIRIASAVAGSMDLVAVFRRPVAGEVRRVLDAFPADLVQADHRSLGPVGASRRLPVFREGPGVESHIESHLGGRAEARFVYEGPVSGAGRRVDWGRAGRIAPMGRMTLAGGLTEANVGEAIMEVRPFGVDVSSGVETRPGVKDPELIHAFVAAVRRVDREMAAT